MHRPNRSLNIPPGKPLAFELLRFLLSNSPPPGQDCRSNAPPFMMDLRSNAPPPGTKIEKNALISRFFVLYKIELLCDDSL